MLNGEREDFSGIQWQAEDIGAGPARSRSFNGHYPLWREQPCYNHRSIACTPTAAIADTLARQRTSANARFPPREVWPSGIDPISTENDLAALRRCEENPTAPWVVDCLRKSLRHRSCLAIERAAQIIGRQKQEVLVPELLAGFQRLLKDPVKNDRGCVAKTAMCEALRKVGHDDHAFFLRGIRYVQTEPGYGPAEDKAGELRAICGFALAETGYRDVMLEPTALLQRAEAVEFLELSDAEEMLVNMKLALADNVKTLRQQKRITQQELARRIGSSQSRIAKMEVADRSVSMEFFVRSLAALGASRTQIGKIVGTRVVNRKEAKRGKQRLANA